MLCLSYSLLYLMARVTPDDKWCISLLANGLDSTRLNVTNSSWRVIESGASNYDTRKVTCCP